jgi:hypothetical protein
MEGRNVLHKTIRAAAIAALVSLGLPAAPAAAQVHVDLPGVEVHVGHRAPPPFRREIRIARPGPDYVWVDGQWDWQGDNWVWVPGRWDRPSYRGARWVRARYYRDGGAWRYEPGHWNRQRLVYGDDYRRWRDERGHRRHRDRDYDRDDRRRHHDDDYRR